MNAEEKIAEQKIAELMFANLPRIHKLKFRTFLSHDSHSQSFIPHFILFSGHSQSLISHFGRNQIR